jgi:hypothetical protein
MSATTEQVTIRVTFTGLLPGTPPQVSYYKRSRHAGGQEKVIAGLVEVRDEQICLALRQIKEGEELVLRIETDWTQPDLPSFVTAFTRLPQQSQTAA